MSYFPLFSLVSFVVTVTLGNLVYFQNQRERRNRAFLLLCLSLAYWALTEYLRLGADGFGDARLWTKLSAFWPVMAPLLLHFALILTEQEGQLRGWLSRALLYLPAAVFSVIGLTTDLLSGPPTRELWGWVAVPQDSLAYNVLAAWAAGLALASVYVCLRFRFRTRDGRKKQQATFVAVGISIPAIAGVTTEWWLPATGVAVPPLTVAAFTGGAVFVGYTIWKYRLFQLTTGSAAEDILRTMSDAVLLLNLDLSINRVNRRAEEILGCQEAELVGRPVGVVLGGSEGDQELGGGRLVELAKTGATADVDAALKTMDGGSLPMSLAVSGLKDEDGSLQGVLLVAREISERKQAEHLLAAMTRSSPVGIYVVQEGKFRFANPGFLALTGYSEEEWMGADGARHVAAEDRRRVREDTAAMLQGARSLPYEYRMLTKSRETRWVLESAASIWYQGKPATLGNCVDISREKGQLEMEGQRLQELELFASIARMLVEPGRFEQKAGRVVAELVRVAQAFRGVLWMVDEGVEGAARVVAAAGPGIRVVPPLEAQADFYREGLAGLAVREGQPVIAQDYPAHPRARRKVVEAGVKSAAAFPIRTRSRTLGVAYLDSREQRHFGESRVRLLGAVADSIGALLEGTMLGETERRQALELASVAKQRVAASRIAGAVSASLELGQVYGVLEAELGQVVRFDRLTIGLVTPEEDAIAIVRGSPEDGPGPDRHPLDYSPLGEVVLGGRPRILRDMATEGPDYPSTRRVVAAGYHSAISVPLYAKGKVLGVLSLLSRGTGRYTQDDLELLQPIADQLALAVGHAQLYRQVTVDLEANKRRLQALKSAISGLALDDDPALALQRLVDVPRELLGARYGSLVSWKNDQEPVTRFVLSGFSEAERQRLEAIPEKTGLLGLIAETGKGARIANVSANPSAYGLPPGHPRIGSFLGVPVVSREGGRGVIYLADKEGAEFSADDERLLDLYGTLAGVVLDRSSLYRYMVPERPALAAFQSSMMEGVAVLDDRGRVSHCNEVGAALLGFGVAEMLGKPLRDLMALKRADFTYPGGLEAFLVAPGSGGPAAFTVSTRRPEERDLAFIFFPVPVGPGEVVTGVRLLDVTRKP